MIWGRLPLAQIIAQTFYYSQNGIYRIGNFTHHLKRAKMFDRIITYGTYMGYGSYTAMIV